VCIQCGFQHDKSTRYIIQRDGKLTQHDGKIFRPRYRKQFAGDEKQWIRMYNRAKRAGMTFLQAEALFAKENGWKWPVRSMPLMPTNDIDWHRKVADVPAQILTTPKKEILFP
jgi:hypothetical protein